MVSELYRFDSIRECLPRHLRIQCIVSTVITEWAQCRLHLGPSSAATRHNKGFHNPTSKYLTLHKYPTFVQKYFWLTRQFNYKTSLRRLCPTQGFYNLISHPGGFRQILTKLIFHTVSLGTLSKGVQMSGWPIRLHQPKHVTYVLTGDVGDKPLEGSRHPAKPPSQRERFVSILLWDIQGLRHLQGGIFDFSQLHKFSLHTVSRL